MFSLSHLEGFIANLSGQRQFFPTDEDETGAAKALMRLQDTYKLDPDTISKGERPGNSPLWALPVQPVILLQCLGRVGATAHLWSLPPGGLSPLVVSLTWVSSSCQSLLPMTATSAEPWPTASLPVVFDFLSSSASQRKPRLLLRMPSASVPRAPLRSAQTHFCPPPFDFFLPKLIS